MKPGAENGRDRRLIAKNPHLDAVGMKRLIWRGLIALALTLTFRTFQFFPGMFYVQESWFALCFLAVLFAYPFWKIWSGLRFSSFEVYLFVLMSVGTILAAGRARQVFGQPLMYGTLSQRAMVLIAALLIGVNLLRCGKIAPGDIEAALLFLAWSNFVLFGTMRLLLNPSNFAAYGDGFVTLSMPGTEPSFKFQSSFILFGVFYYAILGLRTKRTKYYLAAAVLFPVTLGGSGRGLTVCVGATLLFCLYRVRGLRSASFAAVKFICIVMMLGGVSYAIFPAFLSARISRFSDAFTTVLTGSATQDSSATARLFETLAALPYIREHPFFGNGVISQQWHGGAGAVMGEYFFASDIGVVGVVFTYGALGSLLYLMQYRFALVAARKPVDSRHRPLLDATKAFILFSALYSLETGLCVWSAEVTLCFIALLCGISAEEAAVESSLFRNGKICNSPRPA